jgi:hypothetical protein
LALFGSPFALRFWFRIFEAAGKYQNTFGKIKRKFSYPPCTQEFRSIICRKNLIQAQGEAVKKIIATLSKYLLQSMSHDFVKTYRAKLVQIEAQSRKIEAMFKDYRELRIAFAEQRRALGIEIVLSEPFKYLAHRKSPIGGAWQALMLQGDPDDHRTGVPNQVGWDSVRVGSHGYLTY